MSLGDNAPYCKILFEPEQVAEFNRNNLWLFSTISRAIAERDGQKLVKFYKGFIQNDATSRIITQALLIVDYYGGAITHATNAVDKSILISEDNEDIRRQIHKPVFIVSTEDNDPVENQPILQSLGIYRGN